MIKIIQVAFLRFTLSSPAWANALGAFCITIAGLGVGLEDVTGAVVIYKALTLKHVLLGAGSVGVVASRYKVNNPEKLQKMIEVLQTPTV